VRLRGECEVVRGKGVLSRICCTLARLPPAGQRVALSVVIADDGDAEVWLRDFGVHAFRSTLRAVAGELDERIGPVGFRYRLEAGPDGIRWQLLAMRVLGIPLPAFAHAVIAASESAREGRYAFDVRAELPVAGLLVHYRGELDPAPR
jgi:hypothetical protein